MKFKQETSIAKPMREQDTGDISAQVSLFILNTVYTNIV